MKKLIAVLSAILVSVSAAAPCAAADEAVSAPAAVSGLISPLNVEIDDTYASASISGGKVSGWASASYGSNHTAKLSATIQKSSNGTSWSYAGSLGSVTGSGGSVSLNKTSSVTAASGYSYRLKVTVTVYNGSKTLETLTFYSDAT